MRFVLALLAAFVAYAIEDRYLGPHLTHWLHGKVAYWKKLVAIYVTIQLFLAIIILIPVAVLALLGDGTVGGEVGPPISLGRFARNGLWLGNALVGLCVAVAVVWDIIASSGSRQRLIPDTERKPDQPNRLDPNAFRQDVAQWKVGQLDAAERYRHWYNRLFSKKD